MNSNSVRCITLAPDASRLTAFLSFSTELAIEDSQSEIIIVFARRPAAYEGSYKHPREMRSLRDSKLVTNYSE